MKNKLRNFFNCTLLITLLTPGLLAHGGNYPGPGDTVPAGGSGGPSTGGSPTTPGPGGPTTPGGGAPTTPGTGPGIPGGVPGTAPGAPRTGGAVPSVDLNQWSFWWEFNKNPYLALKSKIFSNAPTTGDDDFFLGFGQVSQARDIMKPTEADIRTLIIPALLRNLRGETNNDIVTGCMMALAKIGPLDPEIDFTREFLPFLDDSNQEISETTALSLGILGDIENATLLEDLAKNTYTGIDLVGRGEVPYRTRAFAAYGLAILAQKSENPDIILYASLVLREVLSTDESAHRDLGAACLVGLSLLQNSDQPTQETQMQDILAYFLDESKDDVIRAHAPEALVKGIPFTANQDAWKVAIASLLLENIGRFNSQPNAIIQSSILALGLLGDTDDDELDVSIREALMEVPANVADQQSRNFALVALAHTGSNPGKNDEGVSEVIQYLLQQLSRGKSSVKPWAGMALGVLGSRLQEANNLGLFAHQTTLSEALKDSLISERSPGRVGALAVGLGLIGEPSAGEVMLEKLLDIQDSEARGYLCIGLGLLNERTAIKPIQDLVSKSRYRPELLQQAAIGLGLMGDYELVPYLTDMLVEANSLASQAAITKALGFIGDKRSIAPLLSLLEEREVTSLSRAFGAAALGLIAERSMLPWNTDISCDLNYRASTVTLNDTGGTGIINIL